MAVTEIKTNKMLLNSATPFGWTALRSTTDGATVDFTGKGDKVAILVQNASTSTDATLTIKAGNSLQGVNDLEISVEKGTCAAITVDTGAFKNVFGNNTGKAILIGSSTDLKFAVIELP